MRLLALVFLLLTVAGCKQSKIPENFDYGKIENGIYTNSYFDFEIPVPAKWAVQNQEQVQQLQKQGQEIIAGNNKDLAAKVKAANVNTAILLTVFKNKEVKAGEFNPSFIILSENLGNVPGINKGADYLAHAKGLMQQSNISYQFANGYATEKVGNKEFDRMDVTMNDNNVQQNYYSMIDKNFAFSIIISFIGDEQKNELKEIINHIKFR